MMPPYEYSLINEGMTRTVTLTLRRGALWVH